MSELMYAPIPDVDRYLARLGLARPIEHTVESLNRLILSHQLQVPFENLDSWLLKIPASLEIPALYDKVVNRRRGGYCFELNALFTRLLIDLGFKATACMSRILHGDERPMIFHRGVIVELDGVQYYCDVGFGGPAPAGCVPVLDGAAAQFGAETFFVDRFDDHWWTLSRTASSGVRTPVLQFYVMPQENIDFTALNFYSYQSPDSPFTQGARLNRRLPDGVVSLNLNTFIRKTGSQTETRTIETRAELMDILETYFGIKIE